MLTVVGFIIMGFSALAILPTGQSGTTAEPDPHDRAGDMLGPEIVPIDEVIFGSDGHDVLSGTEDDDWIAGGAGDDMIHGDDGDDALAGQRGNDWLDGGDGDDRLFGGPGDDRLFGGLGNDVLRGGPGDDELFGGPGDDRLFGGAGDDTLMGGWGDDLLVGGPGSNVMMGGAGDDVIDGRQAVPMQDFLNGQQGDDTLVAGAFDILNGGAGEDTFVLSVTEAQHGAATIEDFDGNEDRIVVLYPADGPLPKLSQSLVEGGLALRANGQTLALLRGVRMLDMAAIELVAA